MVAGMMDRTGGNQMKKHHFNNIILYIIILIITCISIYNYYINEKAQKNRCIYTIVNYDEIEKGCDKYFLKDQWYQNYMDQMLKEYKKIK